MPNCCTTKGLKCARVKSLAQYDNVGMFTVNVSINSLDFLPPPQDNHYHSLPSPLFRPDEGYKGDERIRVMGTWGEVRHERCGNLDQMYQRKEEAHHLDQKPKQQ